MAAPEHRQQVAVHTDAQWALFSKHPGSFDDYSVVAASNGPVSPSLFQRIIVASSPGSPPPSRTTGAAALPWAWFLPFAVNDVAYFGVAVREWTDYIDGTNRPVARTRFICLPLEPVISQSVRLTDLYRAASSAVLSQHDPSLIPISLPLSTSDNVVARIQEIGEPAAAAAAARLFEGTVALLGGGQDIESRLTDLDAIIALLPSGARSWLFASSWADSGIQHQHHLTFTQRPRDTDFAIELHAGGRVSEGNRSPYAEELLRLCYRRRVRGVVEHLRTVTDVVAQNAATAEERLRDLDLLDTIREQLRTRSLQRHLVHRLEKQGRFGDLSPSEQDETLTQLLDTTEDSDITAERELFTRHWTAAMDATLTAVTHDRLWQRGWTADQLETLAELAKLVRAKSARAMGAFARGLAPAGGWPHPNTPAVTHVAVLVVRLGMDVDWRDLLGPQVVDSPRLSVAVIRVLLHNNFSLDDSWLNAYAAPGTGWAGISRPYREALSETGHVDEDQLALLTDSLDDDAVPDLIRTTQHRRPSLVVRLMDVAVAYFERIYAAAMPMSVEQFLRGMTLVNPRHAARVDFMLCRNGVLPARPNAGQEYWELLVELVRRSGLSRVQLQKIAENVALGLPDGWGLLPTSAIVLKALWDLGEIASATSTLARLVADEILSHPQLLDVICDRDELAPWLTVLRHDPRLASTIRQQKLRSLKMSAGASEVAEVIKDLLTHGSEPSDLVDRLVGSSWRPTSVFEWADLISLVGVRTTKHNEFVIALGNALMHDHFGHDRTRMALEELPRLLLFQQRQIAGLLGAVAAVEDPRGRHTLTLLNEEMKMLRKQLDDVSKLLKGERSGPLSWVLGKGSGDDGPRHARG